MSVHTPLAAPARTSKRTRTNPIAAGLPDPRPLTDFTATWDMDEGKLRVTITLDQPCIIRNPRWSVVDIRDGMRYLPALTKVNSNTNFELTYEPGVPDSTGFVEPPYQDVEVQNFQGGFVRPAAKWFRY